MKGLSTRQMWRTWRRTGRESRSCAFPCAVCDGDFMTPEGHLAEAERLAWVIDEEIQADAERTLGDLIALARLHLDLYQASPGEE